MAGERPINADVPAAVESKKPSRRRRKPVPAALKAVGGLFALAVAFIVAAILGGGGGAGKSATTTPAPVSTQPQSQSPSSSQPANELGYPEFATANTTRVGGTDAASTAAAVALAAYPSTQPSQRPDAVALVDAADWQGAIAASVLMAPPIGAPVLISEAGALPDPTAQALDALDPQGSKDTKGAQTFVLGGAAAPDGVEATRIGGSGAVAAAAVAKQLDELLGSSPQHIVIAPEAEPAFAMPAAAWAARSGDPVLFSGKDRLPPATVAALKRHPHTPIYVLGPSSAISSGVVREIAKIAGPVGRVSGEDPVSNAIELARYAGGGFGWDVNDPGHGFVVANAADPLDAPAAAALSASGTWGPLLLTDSAARLPDALRGYLLDVKPGYTTDPTRAFYNHVWVIGDEEAIDVSEQAEIDEVAELAKIGGEG